MDGTPDHDSGLSFCENQIYIRQMWGKFNIAGLVVANFAAVILIVAMVRQIRKQKRLLREERVRREVGI